MVKLEIIYYGFLNFFFFFKIMMSNILQFRDKFDRKGSAIFIVIMIYYSDGRNFYVTEG